MKNGHLGLDCERPYGNSLNTQSGFKASFPKQLNCCLSAEFGRKCLDVINPLIPFGRWYSLDITQIGPRDVQMLCFREWGIVKPVANTSRTLK